jgi:hypothetical protein
MLFQRVNRSDAEKVFIIAQNTSGASLGANLPVYFETDAASDGLAVSQMVAAGNLLFAGINDATLADDGYGLVQVYGARTSAVYNPTRSDWAAYPGMKLVGAAYLEYTSSVSGTVITSDSTLNSALDAYVVSMETIAAADGKSATGNIKVFIRAL